MNCPIIALVGNPNSGKTTLFNALTGSHQHIGNWPGVTVARKSGTLRYQAQDFELVDLPGCYSLVATPGMTADIRVTCRALKQLDAALYVNVVDCTHLTRDLYLTLQLRERNLPMLVVLTHWDKAKARQLQVDPTLLAAQLGCQVVVAGGTEAKDLSELKRTIYQYYNAPPSLQPHLCPLPEPVQCLVERWALGVAAPSAQMAQGVVRHALEGDHLALAALGNAIEPFLQAANQRKHQDKMPLDAAIAVARHATIAEWVAQGEQAGSTSRVSKAQVCLDRWCLSRKFGIPIFFAVMYGLFLLTINLGGVLQEGVEGLAQIVCMQIPARLLTSLQVPASVVQLLVEGAGRGVALTLSFVPILFCLFFFLAWLEQSGYLVRATFVIDRLMRSLGLPGEALVSMIIGFGCNVPAVMSTRVLAHRRERILAALMAPFMSCSARLAIYTVFVAAFFPLAGHKVVFALYCLGIAAAMLTCWFVRAICLSARPVSPRLLELPPYKWPVVTTLLRQAAYRVKRFVTKACWVIVPACVILNGCGQARLQQFGQWLTPVFKPMGIARDNWPATVGLLTGLIAKETMIGTLDTLYAKTATTSPQLSTTPLWQQAQAALATIPSNAKRMLASWYQPIAWQLPSGELSLPAMQRMVEAFGSPVAAFAYLIFVLLYFPCISVIAAISRELGVKWALFSVAWSCGLAYASAVAFYQLANFFVAPITATLWLGGIAGCFGSLAWLGQRSNARAEAQRPRTVATPILVR